MATGWACPAIGHGPVVGSRRLRLGSQISRERVAGAPDPVSQITCPSSSTYAGRSSRPCASRSSRRSCRRSPSATALIGPWAQLDPDWQVFEQRRRRDRRACRLAIRNAVTAYASRPLAKHLDDGIQALSFLVDLEFPVTSDPRSSWRVARLEQFREATAKAMPRIARDLLFVEIFDRCRSLLGPDAPRRPRGRPAALEEMPALGILDPLWAEVWYAFPEHEDTPVWFVGKHQRRYFRWLRTAEAEDARSAAALKKKLRCSAIALSTMILLRPSPYPILRHNDGRDVSTPLQAPKSTRHHRGSRPRPPSPPSSSVDHRCSSAGNRTLRGRPYSAWSQRTRRKRRRSGSAARTRNLTFGVGLPSVRSGSTCSSERRAISHGLTLAEYEDGIRGARLMMHPEQNGH